RMRELWAIAGRRSGKSRIAAAVAVYLALFQKHKLAPGEKGVALVLAASVDQARTVFGYVRGFLEASPALAREVAGVKRFEIELSTASSLLCTRIATAPFAVAPWLPPSLTKWRFGATKRLQRLTPRSIALCCRAWPPRAGC